MKKTIIILLLGCQLLLAQTNDSLKSVVITKSTTRELTIQSGKLLNEAGTYNLFGYALMGSGAGATTLGAIYNNDVIMYMGIGFSAIGFTLFVVANVKQIRAGNFLIKLGQSQ